MVVWLALPPSASATVRVTAKVPSEEYTWLAATDPEPFDSVIAPELLLPSPQSMIAVWVSSVPASVNVAESTLLPLDGAVMVNEVIAGATLFTMTLVLADVVPPSSSVKVRLTV